MTTQIDNKQEMQEVSAIRQLRNAIQLHYIETAKETFEKYAELNETELAEFYRVTNNGQIVFTRPSEETLKADAESENPRFSKGRKFGSVQWYKKTQEVGTALALATAYSGYLAYIDSKENQERRDEKKLEAVAALQGITVEELKTLLATIKK